MIPARILPPLLALGLLAGCAGNPSRSYVAPLSTPGDAATLASGITEFMASRVPVASSTLALEPPVSDNALTPTLVAALRRRGFATVDARGEAVPDGARRVRYLVTPMDSGDLVRLSVDGGAIEGSRFFTRTAAGALQPGGPFTVRGAEVDLTPPPPAPPPRPVRRSRAARRSVAR